jgi:hypothetical protein
VNLGLIGDRIKLPAQKAGDLYNTNSSNAGRFCKGVSAPRCLGRRWHVIFQASSVPSVSIHSAQSSFVVIHWEFAVVGGESINETRKYYNSQTQSPARDSGLVI